MLRVLNEDPDRLGSVVSVPFWTMTQCHGMFAEEKDQEGEELQGNRVLLFP